MRKGVSAIPLLVLFISGVFVTGSIANKSNLDGRLFLRERWAIKSTVLVKERREVISTAKFHPRNWYPISVPSTVLTALVRNGVYPDPYVGINNMLIPDASDEFNAEYDLLKYSYLPDKRNPWSDPYWYRTEFKLPDDYKGKTIWLNFGGINYRADVWLNGKRVADCKNMVGMFRRFKLNVTDYVRIGKSNYLGVKIHPLDFPGIPSPPQTKPLGWFGANGGDGAIGKNVTMQCSAGWDWIPAVRDRNMGIWQEVYISATGPVDIRNPHIITDLLLPNTDRAYLTVSAELVNVTESTQLGVLSGLIADRIKFEKKVRLAPGETKEVIFSPDGYPQLIIDNPRLWWPNTYGKQNLYSLFLKFEIGGIVSDRENITFGIRKITSEIPLGKGRVFRVNGKQIFCKGGNWVPDMMLNRDKKRYYDEIRLFAEANLNMVRLWGGGITPPDAFFDACNEFGILVWHDFWITSDCCQALDHDLFRECAIDTIRRLRNHPSLILWCGGNEVHPGKEIYNCLLEELAKLDGTRPFIPNSGGGSTAPPQGKGIPSGVWSGGPYSWVESSSYYRMVTSDERFKFKDEVGLPSLPPASSLRKFIPNLGGRFEGVPFPLDNTWGYHDACSPYYNEYDKAIRDRYGFPYTVTDYAFKAQFVNANSYRTIFEAANQHMWDTTSGILLWKANSAWPSVAWQLYDWYLQPNAAYYYTRKACEALHIQLNPEKFSVGVVNTRHEPRHDLKVMAKVYNFDMKLKWEESKKVNMGANQFREIFTIPPLSDLTPVYFVHLTLRDGADDLVSNNFYWISSKSPADFAELEKLPAVDLNVSHQVERKNGEGIVQLTIENPTDNLALFVNPRVTKGLLGEEVLPTYWEDNYFSILPGETKKVEGIFNTGELGGEEPSIEVGGWNVGASVEFSNLEISKKRVESDEPFTVSAVVRNTGALGFENVKLYLENKIVDSKRILLDSKEEIRISFAHSLYRAGNYKITVGNLPCKTVSLVKPAPATFKYSNLKVIPTARINKPVTVSAGVKNVGGLEGFENVKLYIDGKVRDRQKIYFGPGAEKKVRFAPSFTEAGTYYVGIGALEAQAVAIEPVWIDNNKNGLWDAGENGYLSIGEAIRAAQEGDTIVVRPGNYDSRVENFPIVVAKPGVTIKSSLGPEKTVICSEAKGMVIEVKANNVVIDGFKVMDSNNRGIGLSGAKNCVVKNNIVLNTRTGIFLHVLSSSNTVKNNIVTTSREGIRLDRASNNIVENNTFSKNTIGIRIRKFANNNIVKNNKVSDNTYGFSIEGSSNNNGIFKNFVHSNSTAILIKSNCKDNLIHHNDIEKNEEGVLNNTANIVDVSLNWWGNMSGPGGASMGEGDSISQNVNYVPWLKAPATRKNLE